METRPSVLRYRTSDSNLGHGRPSNSIHDSRHGRRGCHCRLTCPASPSSYRTIRKLRAVKSGATEMFSTYSLADNTELVTVPEHRSVIRGVDIARLAEWMGPSERPAA